MRKRSIPILALLFSCNILFAQEPKLILPIGHVFGVGSSFSPDGKRVVTSGLDYTAKIWEVETGRLLANLNGHTDTLFGANYSPDGKKIVTTCQDGTAKIWNAVSTILLTDLKAHTGAVSVGEFSPDGKKLLTASDDATAKIWDVATGKLLADLRGHTKAIWWAWFSKDGKKVVTCSDDSTAKVWDAGSGKMLADLKGHNSEVLFVEFSPDGKKVITGSGDSTAKIWDAETGNILKDIGDHKAPVRVTHFSPDGKRFVTASDDGDVKLWDSETWVLISNIKGKIKFKSEETPRSDEIVRAADFSPDGKKILTVYLDSSVKIWNAETGVLLHDIKRRYDYVNNTSFSKDGKKFSLGLAGGDAEVYDVVSGKLLVDLKGEATWIASITYSPDGKRMLISNSGGSAKLCDVETGAMVAVLSAIKKSQWGVSGWFSPDGKKIITLSSDGLPRVWDAITGIHLWDIKKNNNRTGSPQFSSNGKKIYSASSDSSFNIWDAASGKLLLDIKDQKNKINYITVSRDDKRIFSSSFKDTVYKIWDAENGMLISQLNDPGKKIVSAHLHPSGEKVLTTSTDSTVQIWDANTGSVLLTIKEPANYRYWTSFSPDGKKIVSVLEDSTAKIWDAETGELILDLKTHSYFFNYEFSPDGNRFLCSRDDGIIKTYDLKKDGIVTEFKGHTAAIMRLQYSNDGKKIVSASQDGTAKVWDAETGTLLFDLKEHTFWVEAAQFSPDGKKVITKSLDYTVKVWDTETGNSLYTFIPVKEEDYLVLDKYNHFDGTEAARKLLYFTCGTEVIELDQVKDQLWVPNLAERILKGETINAAKLSDLNVCNLTPVVDTIEQSSSQYRFRITPRLGGLGVTIVYVNGIEVTRYTPQRLQQLKGEYQLSIDKKDLQKFFVSNKENTISVKSLTAKSSISSRSVSISERLIEKSNASPNLYAVVVGVSDYKGNDLDLKFAAKDAVDMANAIDVSAKKLLNTDGKDHVFVYRVHTAAGRDKFPEKNTIRQLFSEISSKAQPNDILMIFFAGHGVLESEKSQFYFLTADASGATVSGALKDVGISTEELSDWIKPQVMKAQKRILIFDACNSGQAIKEIVSINQDGKNLLAARGDDNGKRIKAIEKLNEKSGMFILSASASNQNAYELGKYNQGALTYSLLKAIKEQPEILEDRQYLNVSRWFDAAEKSVNELSRETGARQQPQLVSTSNFNIGVVDDDVRNRIILPFEKSLFTRSEFRNADLRIDNLKLRTLVDKRLEEISDNKQDGLLLYSPEFDGINIYAISGDYTVAGNTVTLSLILTKGGTEIKAKFELAEALANLDALPERIISFVMDWLQRAK